MSSEAPGRGWTPELAEELRAMGCEVEEVNGYLVGRGPEAQPDFGRVYISPNDDLIAAREARELEAEEREAREWRDNVERWET